MNEYKLTLFIAGNEHVRYSSNHETNKDAIKWAKDILNFALMDNRLEYFRFEKVIKEDLTSLLNS